MPLKETPLAEVGIFCDDGEAMLGGITPNDGVVSVPKPDLPDVNGAGETILKRPA
jgi:hypothetical protein